MKKIDKAKKKKGGKECKNNEFEDKSIPGKISARREVHEGRDKRRIQVDTWGEDGEPRVSPIPIKFKLTIPYFNYFPVKRGAADRNSV